MRAIKINKSIMKENGYKLIGQVAIPEEIMYQGERCKVTGIEKFAFRGCRRMKSVVIPKTVVDIGNYAFSRCIHLNEVTFEGDSQSQLKHIGRSAFAWTAIVHLVLPPNVISLDKFAFADNHHMLTMALPNALKTIDSYAFNNCCNLESVTIPDSVVYLGENVFEGCEGLSNIMLSANIYELTQGTFTDCWALKEVTIPEGISKMSLRAFDGCANIKKIHIPVSMEVIKENHWLWQYHFQHFTYNGSMEDWHEMWDRYNNASLPLTHDIRCTDGVIHKCAQ